MLVILSKDAKKQYDHLSRLEQKKVKKKLLSLEINPLGSKKLSGDLSVFRSLRVWPYRIIYEINKEERRVEISDIEHRQGVYK
ncbi:type II toxin-antitoxin system RelE/ParE family toxin [Candidatus Gottesmanbacteria bacterium]|nr:type II toxin-antitoxin system RelE/ParE family toxin [Candidatus Gottesmanbacteria bacterium]